jgi:succinyl-CoA synthetase beta subunit
MDLFEYQGKELFAAAGIPVLPSRLARTVEEAERAAADLGFPLAVKAQVLSGGRGKAGGVRVVGGIGELRTAVAEILALTIKDKPVTAVLVEQGVEVRRELYTAITLDRAAKRPLLMVSTSGGIDIEQVARQQPQALFRAHIDPLTGLAPEQLAAAVRFCGLGAERLDVKLAGILRRLWQLYRDRDATLVEVNPLALVEGTPGDATAGATGEMPARLMALDAKVSIDDNALYRQPDLAESRPGEDERERRAREAGITYLTLDGDIGVLGNGAGLVMSTLDLIGAAGGRAADFCDVGGGARADRFAAVLDIITSDPRVRALLVNILGGLTRGDEVARGVLTWREAAQRRSSETREDAVRSAATPLPIVVRLEGNNADLGREILASAAVGGLVAVQSALEAVQMVVAARDHAVRAAEGRGA